MLRHIILFQFEKNYFCEEHFEEYCQVFGQLKKEVPGIYDAQVHKNCIDRPANMDLMVVLDLESEAVLSSYLQHPLHCAMGQKYNPHVTNRVSFDYPIESVI